MATYKNASAGAHVHNGKVIAPGATFDAESSANLKKLVASGALEEVKVAESSAKPAGGKGA